MSDLKNLVKDVVASPLGDVIASVGQGVADAQHALDEGSLGAVLDIYTENDDEKLRLLQEIGYRPTFYTLPETTGEVRVALRLGTGAAGAGGGRAVKPSLTTPAIKALPSRVGLNAAIGKRIYATPVDAGYANNYGYSADVSAKLTFKIVPVPAPDGADELRLVPLLTGRTPDDALAASERLGLEIRFEDADGQVVTDPAADVTLATQEPPENAVVRAGDTVVVRVA